MNKINAVKTAGRQAGTPRLKHHDLRSGRGLLTYPSAIGLKTFAMYPSYKYYINSLHKTVMRANGIRCGWKMRTASHNLKRAPQTTLVRRLSRVST